MTEESGVLPELMYKQLIENHTVESEDIAMFTQGQEKQAYKEEYYIVID